MKKILSVLSIFLVACFASAFTGCTKTADLYDLGVQMTVRMEEVIKSGYYFELNGNRPELNAERQKYIANDYDSPVKVYTLSAPDSKTIFDKLSNNSDADKWDELTENVQEQILKNMTINTLFFYINAQNSTNSLMLINQYVIEHSFDGYSLEENVAYLFTFETGAPIAVTFTAYKGGISATAQFLVMQEEITLSALREVFTPFGCEVNIFN